MDEFATPIKSLQQVSSRDSDGPKPGATDMPSYEDILRQSGAPTQQEHHPYQGAASMDHHAQVADGHLGRGPMDMMPQQMSYSHAQPGGHYQHDQHEQMRDDYAQRYQGGGDAPPADKPNDVAKTASSPAAPSGWRSLLQRHKRDIIIALVIFIVIMFVLPRIRAMPRYQTTGLPTYVIGLVSIASGCIGNSIVLAVS